jgi:hypothetical protein
MRGLGATDCSDVLRRGTRREKLNSAVCHQSDNDKRAHYPAGPQGAHVRIGELGSPPEIISLLLGAMTWGGLYARDPRIRAILPLIR